MNTPEFFDTQFELILEAVTEYPLHTEDATTAMNNLETLSKCRPPATDPSLTPEPVPTTSFGRAMASVGKVLDNETTRVFVKAAGALGGVGLVVYSTIRNDHVLERNAIAQANQPPIK